MLKRVLTGACVALLAAGCGSTRNDTSSGSTGSSTTGTSSGNTTGTSSGNTTGQTTSGNTTGQTTSGNTTGNTSSGSGSTGGTTGCSQMTIAQARQAPAYTPVCLTGVTTLYSQSPGAPDAGGTSFSGTYVVADANGDAMQIYKTKYAAPTGDPVRADNVSADGIIKLFPTSPDGGALPTSNPQLGGSHLTINIDSSGNAMPTPKTPTTAQLDHNAADPSMVGSYVLVPAPTSGTWTQSYDPAMEHVTSYNDGGSRTYEDGVVLTDGTSTVWVDTYDMFSKPSARQDKSCFPSDGGQPDFTAGGFKGYYDYGQTPGGQMGAVLFFGDCRDYQ